MSTTLADLTIEVAKLNALLQDPEPGLHSWHDMLAESIRNVNLIYRGPQLADPVKALKDIAREAEEVARMPEATAPERRAWRSIARMAQAAVDKAS